MNKQRGAEVNVVRRNILKSPLLLCIVMMLAIFLLGLVAPWEASETTLYVLVVLISLRSSDSRFILAILLLCTVLTFGGFFISGARLEVWEALANRVFATLAFWVVGLVGWKRIQLEGRLRESELHYRDVLDHMLEGAQILDFNWRYIYVNDTLIKHARQPRENLMGHTLLDVYPAVAGTELFDILRRCMTERISQHIENEFFYPDGNTAWFELSIQPVREGLIILSSDITAHKGAEEMLRAMNAELEKRVTEGTSQLRLINEQLETELFQREELADALVSEHKLLQTLMENIPDSIYFKDRMSRFTRINRAQARVLGVPDPDDAIGKTDLNFLSPDLAGMFFEEEQHILESGDPITNRVEFNPTRDGQPRWFSATKVPIRDEQGQITGIVGVSRDITLNKQAEEALRMSEERFRLISWATKDTIWDWDLQTNRVEWGAGLQAMFHYPPEITNTDGDWWLQRIHPDDREKVKRSMDSALQNGMEFWSKEYRFERADHTYAHIMDRGYILQNEAGKPWRVIGAMFDLTERKRAEDTIRQQNDMLSSLHYITINLLRHRELSQLLNSLVEYSTTFLDAPYAEIMLVENEHLVIRATTENQQPLLGRRLKREEAVLSWHAFDTHEPAVLSDYATWPGRQKMYEEYSLHAVADFPILNEEQCLGVLALGRDQVGDEFTSDEIQYGRFFANLTALVLNNVQLREILQEQSIRDPLTGLFNRRYMEETLQREMRRVTRQLGPLGIIMIDIDHFKRFNDTHGHAAGDRALQRLGRLLQGHVRGEDVACRYGGEEFILILPNTSADVVVKRAEYLRYAAAGLHLAESDSQTITLSLGIAMYPEHGRTIDAVLQAADTALYHAKNQGRNRVVVAMN